MSEAHQRYRLSVDTGVCGGERWLEPLLAAHAASPVANGRQSAAAGLPEAVRLGGRAAAAQLGLLESWQAWGAMGFDYSRHLTRAARLRALLVDSRAGGCHATANSKRRPPSPSP